MKIILKKCFTIIEILIVIFILLAISTVIFKSSLEFSKDYFTVKDDITKIKTVLESAKNKAFLGELDSDWGVYFENSTSIYYLFAGSSFNNSQNFSQYFLDDNNIFTDPPANSIKEIVFKKYSGYTGTSTKVSISSLNSKVKGDIFINQFGNIDIEIKRE